MAAAYIAGAEVLLQWQEEMLPTSFQNMVWCFVLIGMYFKGFSKEQYLTGFFVIIGS
jgi:hypothetical protein